MLHQKSYLLARIILIIFHKCFDHILQSMFDSSAKCIATRNFPCLYHGIHSRRVTQGIVETNLTIKTGMPTIIKTPIRLHLLCQVLASCADQMSHPWLSKLTNYSASCVAPPSVQ